MRLAIALCIGLTTAGCVNTIPAAPATVAPAILAAHPASPQPRPDFSGLWSMDTEASDDPQKKIKQAMQAMKQAGGGEGGMRGDSAGRKRGGGKGGGNGGGRQGRGSAEGMGGCCGMPYGDMSALLNAPETLTITHDDPALLIVDGNQQSQRLYTDFRGASISAGGDLQQRVTVAGWEGAVLVVETTMSSGMQLIQRYQIDVKTGQLMISSAARLSDRQSIKLHLVYRRTSSGRNHAWRET